MNHFHGSLLLILMMRFKKGSLYIRHSVSYSLYVCCFLFHVQGISCVIDENDESENPLSQQNWMKKTGNSLSMLFNDSRTTEKETFQRNYQDWT